MNLVDLATQIQQTSQIMQQSALVAVNTNLTIRNWLIGFYIVEFEQKGEDRAKYGEKLLQNLADKLNEDGFSFRNLKLFRQFFTSYPQLSDYIRRYLQLPDYENIGILQSVIAELKNEVSVIGQSAIAQLKNNNSSIGQTLSAQFPLIPSEKLIRKLSYTHFVQLLPIEDPTKRLFYELECINGTWSVRELNRQIKTLYYERSGLSKLPEKLSNEVQRNAEKETIISAIKSPFTFEFLGLKSKDVVYESDVEQAIIEHLQEFILEMGHGFCFEARQKRILIGSKYYFCDLVFYHRILKCHVLIDLKIDEFSHEHYGQLKTYVNYYKKEVMRADDNPPVGILLVTDKDNALVEFATADSDKDIFISKYLLELPSKEKLINFIKSEISKFE
jgi:predicted nuclease of restriction endonuclease-like (RecB) superfamily